jgi:hypothetical protein
MKLKFDTNNLGISIGVDSDSTPAKDIVRKPPNQVKPSGFYVYGHYDLNGSLFFVGKGTGKRAWSKDRHPLWGRYVNHHLSGKYEVRIIADSMSTEEAEKLEAELISKHSDSLVNWQNMGRKTDFKLLGHYNALRDANRRLIQETKGLESTEIGLAVEQYKKAIEKIAEYAFLEFEQGLVGQLLLEEANELGRNGELEALDRLTLCLIKLGKLSEAADQTAEYFSRYKRDLLLKSSEKIKKRIEKVLRRVRHAQDYDAEPESTDKRRAG